MAGNLRTNRNEILKLVTDFWVGAPAIIDIPGPYQFVIADVDADNNPEGEINPGAGGNRLPFARFRIQHTAAEATSISGRRWRNNGSITANLFVPRNKSNAWMKNGELADKLTEALRSHRGSVAFIGATPRERPINNGFNQVDVVSDFRWNQIVKLGA